MNDIIDLTEESVNFVLDSPKKQETKPLYHKNIYVSTVQASKLQPKLETKEEKVNFNLPALLGEVDLLAESTISRDNIDFLNIGTILVCKQQKINLLTSPVSRKRSRKKTVKNQKNFPSIVRLIAKEKSKYNDKIFDITFARLPKDLADIICPLMNLNEIDVSVSCLQNTTYLRPFMKFYVKVKITIKSQRVLNLFETKKTLRNSQPLCDNPDFIKDCLFKLLVYLNTNLKENLRINLTSEDLISENQHDLDDNDVDDNSDKQTDNLSKGLTVTLRPHQRKAVSWMIKRETDNKGLLTNPLWTPIDIKNETNGSKSSLYVNVYTKEVSLKKPTFSQICQGGILADEMGLGKTISVLGLLIQRKFVMDKIIKQPPTLIVCPTSLVGQWNLEIENKIDLSCFNNTKTTNLKTLIYHSTDRRKKIHNFTEYDVVITTYGVVGEDFNHFQKKQSELSSSSFSFKKISRKSPRFVTENNKSENESKMLPKARGLFDFEWYRVVLDEGHIIKNTKTKAFIGCDNLKTVKGTNRRWILTGTPLQNGLEDVFSLVKFIRLQPWCNDVWWKKIVSLPLNSDKESEAVAIVRKILRVGPIMLRRTKKTTEGFEVSLPVKNIFPIELDFSEEELKCYKILLTQSVDEFNELVKQGIARRKFAQIFTLLLRLRQCCNHTALSVSQKTLNYEQEDKKLLAKVNKQMADEEDEEAKTYIKGQVSEFIRKRRRVQADPNEKENSNIEVKAECPVCFDTEMEDPVITRCGHIMCRTCLSGSLLYYSKSTCPICRTTVDEKELISITTTSTCVFEENKELLDKNIPSSKINWLIEDLSVIQQFNNGDLSKEHMKTDLLANEEDDVRQTPIKVLIFSQWTSFFDILQGSLKKAGLKNLRFDGSMSRRKRDTTIETFTSDSEYNILLISLKAGALGLNLTMASVVYIVDPWFNPAIEEQAINRCHRMGQTRPVLIKRLYMKDSVELRIRDMQTQKLALAEETLGKESPNQSLTKTQRAGISFDELVSFFKQSP